MIVSSFGAKLFSTSYLSLLSIIGLRTYLKIKIFKKFMYTQVQKGFWSFQQEGEYDKYTCTMYKYMYMYVQIHYSRFDEK